MLKRWRSLTIEQRLQRGTDMRKTVIVALLALSACAPTTIANNEAGGLVRVRGMLNGQAKGMQVADAECAKFGKVARYRSTNDLRGTLSYDCVAR